MKAFIAYVYPILKYQPSAFHLAHKIQQPIQKIQIQILTNFLTNLNKFYYSCFSTSKLLVKRFGEIQNSELVVGCSERDNYNKGFINLKVKNVVLWASKVNKLVGVKKFQNAERSRLFARDWLMTSTVQWIFKLNIPTVSSKYKFFEIDL